MFMVALSQHIYKKVDTLIHVQGVRHVWAVWPLHTTCMATTSLDFILYLVCLISWCFGGFLTEY